MADLVETDVKEALLNEQVHGLVQGYVNLMRLNGLSSLMASMGLQLNDESSVFMGKLNDALEREGYEIKSHSHTTVGVDRATQKHVYSLTLWIVTRGGVENRKRLLTPAQSSLR